MPQAAYYIACVILDKGIALLTIPLLAAYLTADQFGSLDVAASVIEFAGLVMTLGLGECLLRFASTADGAHERRRVMAEFLGAALIGAGVLGLALQLLVGPISSALQISIAPSALRWALIGATATAFIEMPLMWMRLEQRAESLFAFSFIRSTLQVALMWLALKLGYGADGVLTVNALVVIVIAAVLSGLHIRDHGIAFASRAFRRVALYGSPLVASGLATFGIGSLSRWFLLGNVSTTEIAHFALAFKLALATPMLLQPFALWWIARRLAVLSEPDGVATSARAWAAGVAILFAGAAGIALVAPVFIHRFFPVSYHPAIALLPAAIMVCVFNELTSLSNAGSHLRSTGFPIMVINIVGSLAAIAGYIVLVPALGVVGAPLSMAAGHAVRLGLYLYDGRVLAPVPYPFGRAVLFGAVASLLLVAAPAPEATIVRLTWSVLCGVLLVGLALGLRMVPWPHAVLDPMLARMRGAASAA